MAKHTMKRSGFGQYIYRGYIIDRVNCYDDEKFSHWNILDESGYAFESADTLKECRFWIDRLIEN